MPFLLTGLVAARRCCRWGAICTHMYMYVRTTHRHTYLPDYFLFPRLLVQSSSAAPPLRYGFSCRQCGGKGQAWGYWHSSGLRICVTGAESAFESTHCHCSRWKRMCLLYHTPEQQFPSAHCPCYVTSTQTAHRAGHGAERIAAVDGLRLPWMISYRFEMLHTLPYMADTYVLVCACTCSDPLA